jgi:hypothetical protein
MYMIMKVPRGSIEEELEVVCAELDVKSSPVYVPRLLIKLGLKTIWIAEKNLNIDCGPTIGIDIVINACNRVFKEGRATVSWKDIRSEIYSSVCTNSEQHAYNCHEDTIDALIPDIAGFLQQELYGIDLAVLLGRLHTSIGLKCDINPVNLKKLITVTPPEPELEKLSAWVVQHEKIYNFRIYEVIAEYLNAYREGIAVLKKTRGRNPANRDGA